MVNIQANPASVRKHVIVLHLPDLQGNRHPGKDGNKVLLHFFSWNFADKSKAHSSINNSCTLGSASNLHYFPIIFLYFLFPCTEAFLFLGKIWFLSYWIWGLEKNPTTEQTFLPLCSKQGNGPCHQKCRHIVHTHKDEISIGQKNHISNASWSVFLF